MLNWQIGKKYRTRDNRILVLMERKSIGSKGPWDDLLYFSDNVILFAKNGKSWNDRFNKEDNNDIIEEIKENEMKIEVGKKYKDDKGIYHTIIHYNTAADIFVSDYGRLFTSDGKAVPMPERNSSLIEEWKEPKSGVSYVNIYQENSGRIWEGGFADLETVKRWAEEQTRSKSHDTILARVRVEWKEGQFDD